jgi:hypothetical protein
MRISVIITAADKEAKLKPRPYRSATGNVRNVPRGADSPQKISYMNRMTTRLAVGIALAITLKKVTEKKDKIPEQWRVNRPVRRNKLPMTQVGRE